MNSWKRRVMLLCTTVIILGATGCVTNATHLGKSPSDHVVLEVVGGMTGGCGVAKLDFERILPNGESVGTDGTGWRIPGGKLLVITDVDWQYIHPDGEVAAGTIQILRLNIENLSEPRKISRAFESTVTLSSKGEGGISESMTSGFIVEPKARICPDVMPGPLGPTGGLQHLILRGYLVRI
jgi:hypothetical protein